MDLKVLQNIIFFYEGVPEDSEFPCFMICILNKEKYDILGGIYSDPKFYDIDGAKLEEFDKKFPYKIKEKRAGQLQL